MKNLFLLLVLAFIASSCALDKEDDSASSGNSPTGDDPRYYVCYDYSTYAGLGVDPTLCTHYPESAWTEDEAIANCGENNYQNSAGSCTVVSGGGKCTTTIDGKQVYQSFYDVDLGNAYLGGGNENEDLCLDEHNGSVYEPYD